MRAILYVADITDKNLLAKQTGEIYIS